MSNLNMTDQKAQPVTMQTQLGTERTVQVDDAVQSLGTGRLYAVTSIDPETGKPNLYRKGHPRIKNANPQDYRIIERPRIGETLNELKVRLEVAHG